MERVMLVRKILQHETGMSRRVCFSLFQGGGVRLNGEQCDRFKAVCQPGDIISYNEGGVWHDIHVSGEVDKSHKTIMLHKPRGYVVARQDRFEKTIYDLLPESYYNRYRSAGRLDKMTSGLIMLSTDGDLVHRLSHPSHHIPKRYRVVLHRPFVQEDLSKVLEGVQTPMFDTSSDHQDILRFADVAGVGTRTILITLHEGKKRHIRRLLRQLGYKVLTLHRQSIGSIQLGSLEVGEYRSLSPSELSSLSADIDHAS